jgi:hypothetical protein
MPVIAPSFMHGPKKFGDPFWLPSTDTFPSDIKSSLDLCLYLYGKNSLYGAICNRIVSYFITGIEFVEMGDKDEQRKLERLLSETLQVFTKMQLGGVNWAIYGQAFVRCVEPFDRWLIDDRGGAYRAISLDTYPEHLVKYDWQTMKYTVPDLAAAADLPPEERKIANLPKVSLPFRDKPSNAPDRFSIVFLDPRYVELDSPHQADTTEYIYRIPPDMESRIKAGKLHEVNHTARGLLEAVAKSKDFRFRKGEVYHFKKPSPIGVSDSGWAVPEILLHYDSLYQLQVYRKADFAIAQDFLLPFRVFSPTFGANISDAVMNSVMSRWRGEMQSMIKTRRKDQTAIHATPFEVNMQEFGGQGKSMVLSEVVETYTNALFDGLGFPRELFRGSINVDQLPNAVRMFERHYEWLYTALDGMLKFVARTVQRAFESDEMEVRLKRPAMAYNAEWMQLKMQMAANREIPRADVYPDIGVPDPENAARRAIEEDQEIQRAAEELSAAYNKERTQGSMADLAMMAAEQGAAAAAQGGAPPAGGPPGGGGLDYSPDPGADPSMVQQRAQEVAAQWIKMHEQAPNSHRKEMQACEAINPTLYASAKDAMEKMRAGAASAGRAQTGQMLDAPPGP